MRIRYDCYQPTLSLNIEKNSLKVKYLPLFRDWIKSFCRLIANESYVKSLKRKLICISLAPVQPDIKGHIIDVTSEKILVTQGNFNRFRVISCCPSKNYLLGKSQRLYYSAYIFFSLFHILYITAGDCNCTCSYDVVQLVHNFPVRN